MKTNRRDLLKGIGMGMGAAAGFHSAEAQQTPPPGAHKGRPLDIAEYQPRSMLHVHETNVERARFPVIDVHTHITSFGGAVDTVRPTVPPEDLLKVMDRRNIHTLVNLTGGVGPGVKDGVAKLDRKFPGRFLQFTQPFYNRMNEPGYAAMQADAIQQAHRDGAHGLKILKSLGLVVRDENHKLIKVDDRRFDHRP